MPQPSPQALDAQVAFPFFTKSPRQSLEFTWNSRIDPLYVVARGMQWQRERETDAGWELVHLLRSPDREVRVLAGTVLARVEGLRAREIRRARKKLSYPRVNNPVNILRDPQRVARANTPYGLEMADSCATCRLRQKHWFCGLSASGLKMLGDASHLVPYPGGALLFVEGQIPRHAYILCSGKVKLSTTSRDGKVLILRIAEAGEALGLSAVISGQPFELTAETIGPCQVNVIDRALLLERIEKNGELGLRASQALSREFQAAYRDIHDLVLSRSSTGKVARLLLSWSSRRENLSYSDEPRLYPALTHEEMAQMIGASRETVTRIIGDMRKRDLIRLDGTTLIIRNRMALEALAV